MDRDSLYFWFSFNDRGEKLNRIQLEHGDLGSHLTHILLCSLQDPPGANQVRERVEMELAFAVIQAWNQIVKQDLATVSASIREQLSAIPDSLQRPALGLSDEQLLCYPFKMSPHDISAHLFSIFWILSQPQFHNLQTRLLPLSLQKRLTDNDFYRLFERQVVKPLLVSAYAACQGGADLRDLAIDIHKKYNLSPTLHHLIFKSLDRLAEMDSERHPTRPQIEFDFSFSALQEMNRQDTENRISDHQAAATGPQSGDQVHQPARPTANTAPEWGQELIIIAKLLPVWLHQLSSKYGYPITSLDQIPDQELIEMRELKITGLWLVGVWRRSPASKKIKNLLGNPYALASAYSIFDYEIDPDLGGDYALKGLKEKANRYGIHLGADVIPNHTAIDSLWMQNNPSWFISAPEPPFPSYSFTGQNLSEQNNFEIRIEDHYYDHSDAAVVFECVNRQKCPEPLYIYHGNDGTHVPWNDTAQLDYLNPDVRRKMIDTIISVSSDFPLIRLDAAMTLTRLHYKRLWFPPPGEGGAIPSRSGKMSSHEEFDSRYGPLEFWQEVLIALNQKNPNALLLAEAFWLMEPYFINHIGMHKVYHSAFMNLLRDCHGHRFNDYLHYLLQNYPLSTLDHFVNFLSTPDEAPAAVTFGKGDRFMAASILLTTFPGTPLFSHNQWEGLEEQYGMEFAAPMNNLPRDEGFYDHYRSQLMPVLTQRKYFSHSERFRTCAFSGDQTEKCQNVIAFSNQSEQVFSYAIVNYQDCSVRGRLKPPSSVPEPYKIDYLTRSHNIAIADGPFSEIEMGPWGYCVLTLSRR